MEIAKGVPTLLSYCFILFLCNKTAITYKTNFEALLYCTNIGQFIDFAPKQIKLYQIVCKYELFLYRVYSV